MKSKKAAKLSKRQLVKEAEQQRNALKELALWMKIAMVVSACGMVLAWWGFTGTGMQIAFGVVGAILSVLGIVCAAIIGLGVRNGNRNVKNILRAAGIE